jgi:hypothetical protein
MDSTSIELLFFPPKEFSARYGKTFFSADIVDYSIEGIYLDIVNT